ncbi:MAG: tetratricopeptide repeat protein, partial [Thermoplasmata archaeon]|nr:tetratricopeptide repeat protein [Thermoplasmata archaeon]
LKLDRKEEAVERFKTAIALNPSSPAMEKLKSIEKDKGFLKTQAAHFSDEGKFREALRYYTLILRHDTENIKALIGMSVALRGMKRFDDAEKALKKVLDIDYYNSLALDELAKCYRDRLAQEPRDVDAWIARGDILVELGRKEEGLMCFNKALDVNPDYEEAKIRVQDMNPAPVWEGHMKEDVIQEFVKIPGIGRARANALIEAGYDSMKKLEKASMKDVAAVKGIDQRLARGIIASVRPYG